MGRTRKIDADELRAAREAADWFLQLSAGTLVGLQMTSFGKWLAASDLNRIEFNRISLIWDCAPALSPGEASRLAEAGPRFAWHLSDAWQDAICPAFRCESAIEQEYRRAQAVPKLLF